MYVLDEMQLYEVPYLVKQIDKHQRPAWEQARYTSLIVANSMGAKLKPKDLQFAWETEKPTEESKPDIATMRAKLNELKNKQK